MTIIETGLPTCPECQHPWSFHVDDGCMGNDDEPCQCVEALPSVFRWRQ